MNKIDPDEGTDAGLLTAGALVSAVSDDYGDTNKANISSCPDSQFLCL